MNLNQLVYLRELLYHGSFTQAARNLGISQPALSSQIRKLEEEAELVLINRDVKPVQLTEEGMAFYEIASEVLQRFDDLKDLPFQLEKEVKGILRLGIIPTLAPYFVSLFLNELLNKYPGLELKIEEIITEDIIHQIKAGYLDAGIISTPVVAGNLNFKPLFYEKFFLYVSDRHPLYKKEVIALDDIDLAEIWYLKEGNCFRNQVDSICSLADKRKDSQQVVYISNSIESLRRIVERQQGITFIPELATIHLPSEQEDMIKRIAGREPVREISLVLRSHYSKKHLLGAFTEVALSQLPAHMKKRPSKWVVDTDIKLGS